MFNRFSWSAIEVGIRQLFQFFVLLVLMRFVSPAEFGIMAIAIGFVALGEALAQSGLQTALLQREKVEQIDLSTVFWLCVGLGLALMGVLMGTADLIADGFVEPRLAPLIMVVSVSIPLAAGGAVHTARLTREGDFKRLTIPTVLSILVSGAVAMALAIAGYGLLALAAQPILSATVRLAALFVVDRWRPSLRFDFVRAGSLMSYGGFVLGATLIGVAAQRFSAFVIGGSFGVGPLGFFSRAESLALLLPGVVAAIFGRIYIISFARAHQGAGSLGKELERAVLTLALLVWPAMVGLATVAPAAIETLFGENWLPSAPLLAILALSGVATPFFVVFYHALLGVGRSGRVMTAEIVANGGIIGLIIAGSWFGLKGVAWAILVGQFLRVVVYAPMLAPFLMRPSRGAVCDLLAILAASAAMALGVHYLETTLAHRVSGVRLALQVFIAAIAFLATLALWHGFRLKTPGTLTGGLFPLRLAMYRND